MIENMGVLSSFVPNVVRMAVVTSPRAWGRNDGQNAHSLPQLAVCYVLVVEINCTTFDMLFPSYFCFLIVRFLLLGFSNVILIP